MKAESLLLLQALEGAIDQAFADVEPCNFAAGDCLIQEDQASEHLIMSPPVWWKHVGKVSWGTRPHV